MLSLVTVSMNRTEHLLRQAREVSALSGYSEHIILDFGSTTPISRNQLPSDERIKLHRVESPNGRWWLTHSYNLAFALASGDYILKLDADILLSQRFIDAVTEEQIKTGAHLMCNRLTLQDWSLPSELFTSNGLFLCRKSSLALIGGFNPYLQGWGWDEIDLYSRFFLAGFPASRIPQHGLKLIQHDNSLREHPIRTKGLKLRGFPMSVLDQLSPDIRMQAQNEKNRYISVASIIKKVTWPSLHDYAEAYLKFDSLPELLNISLFSAQEKLFLETRLIDYLLRPSHLDRLCWYWAKTLGFGPYSPANTLSLLNHCNIDLSLVA